MIRERLDSDEEDHGSGLETAAGTREPPTKRSRGEGAAGLLMDKGLHAAYIQKHVPKAIKVLDRVMAKTGMHYCVLICQESEDSTVESTAYISPGLRHLSDHINLSGHV